MEEERDAEKRLPTSNLLISIIAVVIVVLAIYLLFFNKGTDTALPQSQNGETEVSSAGRVDGQIQSWDLETVGESSASGTVTRRFEDGVVSIGVRVSGLSDLSSNRFYEAYLVDGQDSEIFAGRLAKSEEGETSGDYVAGAQFTEDLSRFSKLIVTLELVDDKKSETVILQGDMGE